jgi:hypothetical protein
MTSIEILNEIDKADRGKAPFGEHKGIEARNFRATLEVAYQLAILNENNTLTYAQTSQGNLLVMVCE